MKVFKRRDNMLRHKKSVHGPRDLHSSESETDVSEDTGESSTEGEVADAYDPWESLVQRATDECREEFEQEVDNLTQRRHMDQQEARRKAYKDLQPTFRKALMTLFIQRITWCKAMEHDPVYKTIRRTVNNLIEDEDFDRQEAWKYAVSKRKYLLDTVLEEFEPPQIEREEEGEFEREDEPPTKRLKV